MTEIKPEEYRDYLSEEYLDVHQAAEMLDIREDELWKLVREHGVATHTIAGAFLRFRRKDIEELKNRWRINRELFPKPDRYFAHESVVRKSTIFERAADWWYFNDFYVLASLVVGGLLYLIFAS